MHFRQAYITEIGQIWGKWGEMKGNLQNQMVEAKLFPMSLGPVILM